MNKLNFAVGFVILFTLINAPANPVKCEKVFSSAHMELKDRQSMLEAFSKYPIQQMMLGDLLDAQEQGLRVSFEQGGDRPVVGRVSDVRLEDGKLVLKIEGQEYRPIHSIHVQVLGPHIELRNPKAILEAMISEIQKQNIERLLYAQEHGLRVSYAEGADRPVIGTVSNVRLENGKPVLKIEDQEYRPIHGINVQILGRHIKLRNPKSFLEAIKSESQIQNVERLLYAQEHGLRVSVTDHVEIRGRVSDVHILNGDLVYKIDGVEQMPFFDSEVKILEEN